MKDRMSRDHKKRKHFKVDQMLSIVEQKDSTDYQKCKQHYKFMSMMFIGVFNKAMFDQTTMNVEIFLMNNMQRRRMSRGAQPVLVRIIVCLSTCLHVRETFVFLHNVGIYFVSIQFFFLLFIAGGFS